MTAATVTAAATPFNNANSYIGVGSGSTAAAVTDTALQTQLMRKAMDGGYPTIAGNVLTFRATFATTDANGAWNEWGVFNASTGGTMLNRKVEALGTKPSTQSWQFTVTLTVNAA
jgi:hypothetical protein